MSTFDRIYTILLGVILAVNISLVCFAYAQTNETYAGPGVTVIVLSFASLLTLVGLDENNPFALGAGVAAFVGNLIMMGYLLSIVL